LVKLPKDKDVCDIKCDIEKYYEEIKEWIYKKLLKKYETL
jgi:hypothetical protein